MENNLNLTEVLQHIDPAILDYQDWVNVGMALKHEGYTANIWEDWSRRDVARYHAGECFRKWAGFLGSGCPVTGGTIVQLAKDHGWRPERKEDDPARALGWDDEISDEHVIVSAEWLEGRDIQSPQEHNWYPAAELIRYIETLFDSTENVGYVTEVWEKDGKYLPTKGHWGRTAGELIQALNKCNGDIGAVLGDYKEEAGAWIRFNPLDGHGCKNENVTDYRYALVESDTMEIDKQNAIIRALELPVACLVFSGGKSVHAIVKIEASGYDEYRKRVNYLYDVCQKNGLKIDSQNRNPSRLSRMPGVTRNGQKQFLIDTNIGKESWAEWHEWIEGVNDDLPEPESLADYFNDLPPLAPPLIHGVLRQGHKMLLAGPSKAGKSYALIELCIAIAEGKTWLQWQCAQGKVMYVNLELDRASCLHRFKDVYGALGLTPDHIGNIDIWNLRGKSVPMDKLAPKLIRRAAKKNYTAIIIDPIYKVITGDENSADQMAHFCNQFDKVCTDLGSAVIYCHHHSKGYQGGKRSMDRASGSGVFARDPDALLDLTELEMDKNMIAHLENRRIARHISNELKRLGGHENISQDDELNRNAMYNHAKSYMTTEQYSILERQVDEIKKEIGRMTAWRIEGTLREFPKFNPVNLWFDYPAHRADTDDILKNASPEGERLPWQKAMDSRKSPEDKKEERKAALDTAYEALGINERITIADLSEYLGVSAKTVKRRISEHGGYKIEYENGQEGYVICS